MSTNERTTSIEYWCWSTVTETIKALARTNRFRGDNIQQILPEAVIMRYNRRPSKDERSTQSPERGIPNPGIVTTYLGHKTPPNAGENGAEDGVVQILVGLVDAGDDGDATNAADYLRWLRIIRGSLQEKNTTGLSPLEQCPLSIGQVYLVHVTEMSPADETDWGFVEHLRMGLAVSCYTRTTRTLN